MSDHTSDNNSGNIVAIFTMVILAAMAFAFVYFGLPMMRQGAAPSDGMNIKVEMPTPATSAETEPQP